MVQPRSPVDDCLVDAGGLAHGSALAPSPERDSSADDDSSVEVDCDSVPKYEDYCDGGEEEEGEGGDGETKIYPEECSTHRVVDYDVIASLDAPDDKEEMDTSEGSADVDIGDGLFTSTKHDAPRGIQQKLLWAVHNRLRIELRPKTRTKKDSVIVDAWLTRYLQKSG